MGIAFNSIIGKVVFFPKESGWTTLVWRNHSEIGVPSGNTFCFLCSFFAIEGTIMLKHNRSDSNCFINKFFIWFILCG